MSTKYPAGTQDVQTKRQPRREEAFTDYLYSLSERGRRKELAALRRGLSAAPGTVSACYPVVAPWTRGLSPRDEFLYYLVASLYALHPQRGSGSLGKVARQLAEAGAEESTEKRLLALQDEHDDEALAHYLRQFVGLAKASDVGVDYLRLLNDLRFFNLPNSSVQRRWAKDFYTPAYRGDVGADRAQERKPDESD